jgi:hypothetical protein
MKRGLYPVVKHSARWALFLAVLSIGVIFMPFVSTGHIMRLQDFFWGCLDGGLTVFCYIAAGLTILLAVLEQRRSRGRVLLVAKAPAKLLTDSDDAIEARTIKL